MVVLVPVQLWAACLAGLIFLGLRNGETVGRLEFRQYFAVICDLPIAATVAPILNMDLVIRQITKHGIISLHQLSELFNSAMTHYFGSPINCIYIVAR